MLEGSSQELFHLEAAGQEIRNYFVKNLPGNVNIILLLSNRSEKTVKMEKKLQKRKVQKNVRPLSQEKF